MTQLLDLLQKMNKSYSLFKIKLSRLARARSWHDLNQLWKLVFYDVEAARQELQLMAISMIQVTTRICLRDPSTKNFSGHAYIDSRGVRTIDVSPSVAALGLDAFYQVVLHEIAHHIFHVHEEDKLPPIIDSMHGLEGAFYELEPDAITQYENDPREGEAKDFVREMDRIAKERSASQFGNYEIRNRIHVLKNITFLNQEKMK